MSIIKGIFKYALILVLIALGVCVIGLAVMIFTGATLFGYKYISYSTTNIVVENGVSQDYVSLNPGANNYYGEFDSIVVDAPDMNVSISNNQYDFVGISASIDVKGFVNVDDVNGLVLEEEIAPQIFKIYEPQVVNNTLYLSIRTVDGLLSYNKHTLDITIPAHIKTLEDITVNCEDGEFHMYTDGNRVVESSGKAYTSKCAGTLSVTTTTGRQIIEEASINNVVSISERGDLTIANLYSEFDYNGNTLKGITGTLTVENEYGDVTLGENTQIGGGCVITSDHSRIKLNDVYNSGAGDSFIYNGSAAFIELNDIYGVATINSADAQLNLNSVKKSITDFAELSINQGKGFSLNIEEIDGTTVNVVTESGSVNIGKLKSDMTDITTKSGNVNIEELYSSVKVITENGNININQKDVAQEMASSVVIDIQTDRGNVIVNDIQSALNLRTTGNAAVKLRYAHVYANSNIQNGDGNLEIEATYEKYVLVTSGAGSFDVKIAQVEYNNQNTETISFVSLTEADVEVITSGEGDNVTNTYKEIATGNILNILNIVSSSGAVNISNSVA